MLTAWLRTHTRARSLTSSISAAAAATLTYMQESSKRLKIREKKLRISSRVATGLSDEISTVRFIALKVEHTYEVAELCDRIARGKGLSPADVDLAVFG